MARRLFAAVIVAAAAFVTDSALATSQRTFVSSRGNDANPCSLTQPCRGFARAITQTTAGGEVLVLDPAGYGPVTITQSVTIAAPPGIYGGISVLSGVGVSVNITRNDVVTLKGLTITGVGGATGISFVSDGTLRVQDCTIQNMVQNGISIAPNAGGIVVIAATTLSNNDGSGLTATAAGSGTLALTLDHVKATNNGFDTGGYGVRLIGGTGSFLGAMVRESLLAENGVGLRLDQTGANSVFAFVVQSGFSNNAKSMLIGAGTKVDLERTAISSRQPFGVLTNNGTLETFGDNALVEGIDGNPPQPTILQ